MEKRRFESHFVLQTERVQFYQDGLGTNIGKTYERLRQNGFFCPCSLQLAHNKACFAKLAGPQPPVPSTPGFGDCFYSAILGGAAKIERKTPLLLEEFFFVPGLFSVAMEHEHLPTQARDKRIGK